jgi:hypothetical protein
VIRAAFGGSLSLPWLLLRVVPGGTTLRAAHLPARLPASGPDVAEWSVCRAGFATIG